MKHTPEPWKMAFSNSPKRLNMLIKSVSPMGQPRKILGEMFTHSQIGQSNISEDEMKANAKRIIDCVNALAGIENPEAFVKTAKELSKFFNN